MSDYTIEDAKRDLRIMLENEYRDFEHMKVLAFIEQQAAEIERLRRLNDVLDDNFADLNEVWRRVNAAHGTLHADRDHYKAMAEWLAAHGTCAFGGEYREDHGENARLWLQAASEAATERLKQDDADRRIKDANAGGDH